MLYWFIGICSFCFILIVILLLKLWLLKGSYKELSKGLDLIQKTDTNQLLTIPSKDRTAIQFVEQLNEILSDIRQKELQYWNGNQKIQRAITNVAHDLRTPLTAISGYVELLEKEKLTQKQKKSLLVIKNRTEDLIYLTEQLFDYLYHLDHEKISFESICLNQELENVLLNYYAVFKEKGIEPIIHIPPIKVYRILNKNMLVRILDNLLINAIKYGTSSLTISLTLTGKIIFSNPAPNLDLVSVRKIFDRYTTLENARNIGGVGLSIVKQLVELNQGRIEATVENGNLIIIMDFKSQL